MNKKSKDSNSTEKHCEDLYHFDKVEIFESIINQTSEAVWVLGPDMCIIYVNQRFEQDFLQAFGIVLKNGVNILKSLPKSIASDWELRYRLCFEQKEEHRYLDEFSIENRKQYIETQITPIVKNNIVIAASCNSRNITELKETKIKLESGKEIVQKNQAYLTTLINTLPDLIWLKDKNGVYQHCNKRFEDFFGAPINEIINKTDYDFVDKELADFFTENDRKAMDAGHALINEEKITFASDGHTEYLETIKTPLLNSDGKVLGILGVGRDITERKMAERKLLEANNQAIENNRKLNEAQRMAKIGHWEYDLVSDKLYWSDEIYRIFELDKNAIEISYANFLSYVHEEDREKIDKAYQKHINNQEPYSIEHRITLPNNKIKHVEERCTSEFNVKGEPLYSKGVIRDISEQKEHEKELLAAKEKAEESDRLKSMFLANMSHEIRTPMNAIIGFSNLLRRDDLSDEQKEQYLDFINNGSQRLMRLISDILDVSKIDANQLSISPSIFAPNKLIDQIEKEFQFRIKSKHLHLESSKSEGDDWTFYADESRIHQILSNLIDNAIKFTQKGKIEFGYNIIQNKILFHVRDTGLGIKEEDYGIIFNRFGQADRDDWSEFDGTGLGLSIVKSLVELMNGKIWLHSKINKGTCFFVELPLHLKK